MFSLYTLLALPVVAALLGSALVSLAICLHDLLRRRHSLPSLHYRESALNSRLLARCGLRQRVFSPSFWLTSRHVQTVLAACWPRGDGTQEVSFQREYLQMRDKGVVALDWVISVQPRVKRKATVLLVLPPVTGDAHTVSSLCCQATKRGFKTVVFNRRGHGGSVLTTAKLLSSADPSDLRQVVKYLRLRFPKSRLAAVAYGTGCGLLISYLGEFGSSALLSAGACVSPCYDTVEKFSGSLRSVYDLVHLLKLKWILLRHAKALSSLLDVRHALTSVWSFGSYEEKVYCKMYNYVTRSDSTSQTANPATSVNNSDSNCTASNTNTTTSANSVTAGGTVLCVNGSNSGGPSPPSTNGQVVGTLPKAPAAQSLPPPSSQPQPPSQGTSPSSPSASSNAGGVEEYWERNNPIRDVDDIAVPVLCINSLDDPFYAGTAIPYDLFRCYPNFLLVVTEKGGHCGFLESYPFRSWADCLCLDYLEAVFELTTRGYTTPSSTSTAAAATSSSSSNSRRNTRSTI